MSGKTSGSKSLVFEPLLCGFFGLLSLPGFRLWYTVRPLMELLCRDGKGKRNARERRKERIKALNGVWLWMLTLVGCLPPYSNSTPPSWPACRFLQEPRCLRCPSPPILPGKSPRLAWRTRRGPQPPWLKSRYGPSPVWCASGVVLDLVLSTSLFTNSAVVGTAANKWVRACHWFSSCSEPINLGCFYKAPALSSRTLWTGLLWLSLLLESNFWNAWFLMTETGPRFPARYI